APAGDGQRSQLAERQLLEQDRRGNERTEAVDTQVPGTHGPSVYPDLGHQAKVVAEHRVEAALRRLVLAAQHRRGMQRRDRPAGPTNGAPCRSSWSPGCSPTMTMRASVGPLPNTVRLAWR